MTRPRLLLLVLSVCATLAQAQTMQQTVDGEKAKASAKIDAARLPDNLKAALRARLANAARGDLNSQFTAIQKIDSDVGNVERAWSDWQAADTYIRGLTDLTQKARDYYAGLMAPLPGQFLPADYNGIGSQVARLKNDADNCKALIVAVRKFMADVNADQTAPPALKLKVTRFLQAIIDRQGGSAISSDYNSLADAKTDFNEGKRMIGELDKLQAKVASQSPANFPAFIENTNKKIAELRNNVGNPMGATTFESIQSLGTRWEQRNVFIKICAQVLAKVPRLPPEDQPSYTRSAKRYADEISGWTIAPDEQRIRNLLSYISMRVP